MLGFVKFISIVDVCLVGGRSWRLWCIYSYEDEDSRRNWNQSKQHSSVKQYHRAWGDCPASVPLSVYARFLFLVVWHSSSALFLISEVNLRWARLVLGWVTMSRFSYWCRCQTSISVCNQPSRSTQPGHPVMGRCNEYQPKGSDALQLGNKGRCSSCVGSG